LNGARPAPAHEAGLSRDLRREETYAAPATPVA
jgi:hypothetical protein